MKEKAFQFKPAFFLGLIYIAIISFVMLVTIPSDKSEYRPFEKQIASLSYEKDRCYITMIDDDVTYVIYDKKESPLSSITSLKSGDEIIITVHKDYQKPTYAIIYGLKINGVEQFNLIDYYYQHDKGVFTIATITLIGIILVHLAYFISFFKKNKQKANDYCIKEPASSVYFSVLTLVFGLIPSLVLTFQYLRKKIVFDQFGYMFVFLIFIISGSFLLYWSLRTRLQFKDGYFTYIHAFKGKQKASISDIKYVEISGKLTYSTPKINFYNYDNVQIMSIGEHGFMFNDGLLIQTFINHSIPYTFTMINETKKIDVKQLEQKHKDDLYTIYYFENIILSEEKLIIKKRFKEEVIFYQDLELINILVPQNRLLSKHDNLCEYHYFTFILQNHKPVTISFIFTVKEVEEMIAFLVSKGIEIRAQYYENVANTNRSYGD